MEDENGLDLSLALPCGGCPASWKSKTGRPSNVRADCKFLDGNTQKLDGISLHGSDDRMKDEGSFFSNLSSKSVNIDASRKFGGFWTANDSRLTEVEEEKASEVGHKRKSLFGKSERDALYADLLENTRTSNSSINRISGSTAGENEDIANIEAEGSTSGPVSHHDDSSKQCDSGYADLTGKRRLILSSDKEIKLGNTQFSVPFLGQPVNILNMPYFAPLKDSSNPTGTIGGPSYPIPGIVPMMAATGRERPGTRPIIPANMPPMFGYSPVMLPSLDKNNSYDPISHFQHQQFHQSYTRGPLNINKDNESLKISQDVASQSSQYNGKAIEQVKSNHATKEGCSSSSTYGEENSKGSNIIIFPGKRPSEQPQTDGLSPSEFPPIRLGAAADLKFGGCGSSPDLPWVSTTGPNGKTISGVTYWFSPTQIKIVCACHGLHLSPDEFVLHASAPKTSHEVGTGGTPSFPGSNSAASAQN
nr:ninja-family protein mc410 [Ipomoea batatas]